MNPLFKSKNPKLSIITIVLNNKLFLEQTILSVINQDFNDYEFIIIDGGSTDGTLDVIKKYESHVTNWVSEKDSGIYNAINKGLSLARGEWVNILNSGDRLHASDTLAKVFKSEIPEEKAVLYGNWFLCSLVKNPDELTPGFANYSKGELLHQSMIYKKKLHETYGMYIDTKKLIISDYIFFLTLPPKLFHYLDFPVSINDVTGVSSGYWSYRQKLAFDYILGKISLAFLFYENLRIFIPRIDLYIFKRLKKIFSKLLRN